MATPKFEFIDLFAGIGGIRIAFRDAGGKCVFSSEYDKFAQETYERFFNERPDFSGITDIPHIDPPGDITKFPVEKVPPHDILTGGFPCQPFSLAGVSKKTSLGRPHGFDDPTQGTLFFNIKEIMKKKRPKAYLLENVKHLVGHNGGDTFRTIKETILGLGYTFDHKVIDAKGWVPQHRQRTFMIGFRKPKKGQDWNIEGFEKEFEAIKPPKKGGISLDKVLEKKVPEKYTLGPGTWATLIRHKDNHEEKGHGFGYGMIKSPYKTKTTRTLSARYHKDGGEILIFQGEHKNPRRLTPLECCRLMGYPEKYQIYFERNGNTDQPVSDTQAYRQFGNSVVVPLLQDIAKVLVKKMADNGALNKT